MAVLTYEGVDDAALAHIGTAHHGEARDAFFLFADGLFGAKFFDNEVEQVARTASCGCADADGVAQSEAVKFGGSIAVVVVVRLVGTKDDGHLRAAQDGSHLHI